MARPLASDHGPLGADQPSYIRYRPLQGQTVLHIPFLGCLVRAYRVALWFGAMGAVCMFHPTSILTHQQSLHLNPRKVVLAPVMMLVWSPFWAMKMPCSQ